MKHLASLCVLLLLFAACLQGEVFQSVLIEANGDTHAVRMGRHWTVPEGMQELRIVGGLTHLKMTDLSLTTGLRDSVREEASRDKAFYKYHIGEGLSKIMIFEIRGTSLDGSTDDLYAGMQGMFGGLKSTQAGFRSLKIGDSQIGGRTFIVGDESLNMSCDIFPLQTEANTYVLFLFRRSDSVRYTNSAAILSLTASAELKSVDEAANNALKGSP